MQMKDQTNRKPPSERPITPELRASWQLAWSKAEKRALLYARTRLRGIRLAWRGTGITPLFESDQDLINAAWEIIVWRRIMFDPGNYDVDPDRAAAYFFQRPIDEVARRERRRAKALLHRNFKVIGPTIDEDGNPIDPMSQVSDPSADSEGVALLASFLTFVEQRNAVLAEVAAHALFRSPDTSMIALEFEKSDRWARERKKELKEALNDFLATGH